MSDSSIDSVPPTIFTSKLGKTESLTLGVTGAGVYNGDIGFVTHIDPDEQELTATFDEHIVTYAFGELDELVLCYATTIHKSQGSEYPVVVIPVSTHHFMLLKRNVIYTGIPGGKRLVTLVGQTAISGRSWIAFRWPFTLDEPPFNMSRLPPSSRVG